MQHNRCGCLLTSPTSSSRRGISGEISRTRWPCEYKRWFPSPKWNDLFVFGWQLLCTGHLLVWAGSPTVELNRQTHRKTEVEVDYSVCSFLFSHQWMFNVAELIKFPILFFFPSLPYVSSWTKIEGCTHCTSCTVQCRRKGGIIYVAVESYNITYFKITT